MNIVLIGYRGTGKSVVGEELAASLGMPCINMDARIVERAGMPIPEIVDRYGWPKFRDMESEAAREVAELDNTIIDTGGGVIERPENVEALRTNSLVFWLEASVDVIISRIAQGTERPALTAGRTFTDEVKDVLERRTPLYKSAAQYEIDTDRLTVREVADRISGHWEKAQQQDS